MLAFCCFERDTGQHLHGRVLRDPASAKPRRAADLSVALFALCSFAGGAYDGHVPSQISGHDAHIILACSDPGGAAGGAAGAGPALVLAAALPTPPDESAVRDIHGILSGALVHVGLHTDPAEQARVLDDAARRCVLSVVAPCVVQSLVSGSEVGGARRMPPPRLEAQIATVAEIDRLLSALPTAGAEATSAAALQQARPQRPGGSAGVRAASALRRFMRAASARARPPPAAAAAGAPPGGGAHGAHFPEVTPDATVEWCTVPADESMDAVAAALSLLPAAAAAAAAAAPSLAIEARSPSPGAPRVQFASGSRGGRAALIVRATASAGSGGPLAFAALGRLGSGTWAVVALPAPIPEAPTVAVATLLDRLAVWIDALAELV